VASPFPLSPHKAIAIEPGAFDAQFGNGIIDNATKAVINVLLGGWKSAIADGSTSNLAGDVEHVVSQLRGFQEFARRHLPVANDGLQGHTEQFWLDRLQERHISVYESEDVPGHFCFTGCESDHYTSHALALVAAIQSIS